MANIAYRNSKQGELGEWAVQAKGLVKIFGENRAVDGVDLNVRAGTVYGFIVCAWAISWIFAFFGVIARTASSVSRCN